jgi:hypothetical protein
VNHLQGKSHDHLYPEVKQQVKPPERIEETARVLDPASADVDCRRAGTRREPAIFLARITRITLARRSGAPDAACDRCDRESATIAARSKKRDRIRPSLSGLFGQNCSGINESVDPLLGTSRETRAEEIASTGRGVGGREGW